MDSFGWIETVSGIVIGGGISVVVNRYFRYGFVIWVLGIAVLAMANGLVWFLKASLTLWLPMLFVHVMIVVHCTLWITFLLLFCSQNNFEESL